MDDEVAAEILSAKNRQLKRKESLSHQLPFIQESGAKNVLTVEIPPSVNTAPSSPQNVPHCVTFSPSHSSSTFKQSFQPLLPSPECSFFKPLPIRPVPDMRTNFQPIDSKAFSGLKNGFTAFDKITKIKTSIQNNNQNTMKNDNIYNTEVPKNDIENNNKVTLNNKAEIEIKVVEEKAIESKNLGDFECQDNSTDMVYPTDDSYEQDDNCNDVVDCDMSEFENNDDKIETEYPATIQHHTHDEKLIKENQKSETNKRNGEIQDFRKTTETNKKPVTVNYYGNLKFVSLKVKSSKPRPLLEEEYSAMTSSTNCSDSNEYSDEVNEHQDKKISHKNVEKNVKKEKKRKVIDGLKKKKLSTDEKAVSSDDDHVEDVTEKENAVSLKSKKQQNVKKSEKNTKIIDNKIMNEKLPGKILKTKNEKISKKQMNKPEETSQVVDSVEDAIVDVEVGYDGEHYEETKSSPLKDKIVIIDKNKMNAKKAADVKRIEEDESEKENNGGNLQSVKILAKNDAKNKIKNGLIISIQPEKIIHEKMIHAEIEKESVRAVAAAQFPAPTQNIRGATPYALFCATRKLEMKNKNILSSTTDLLKVISAEWKVLGLAEKEQWVTLGLTGSRESSVQSRDNSGVDKTHDVTQSSKSKISKKTEVENPVVEVVTRDFSPLPTSKNNKDELSDKKTQPINTKAKKSGKILMDAIVEETITTTSENFENDNTFGENETEILSKQKTKRKDQKRKKIESDNSDDLTSGKRGRSVPEKVAEEEVPSSFDKKAEETLFSSSLSLSPVLAMPSSPVFLAEIPQGKKQKNKKSDNNIVEKVSRKRDLVSSSDDVLLPSRKDDNEIITNALESNKLHNIMPPPKIPSKKMKRAAKTDIPKIDDALFEDVFQAPKGFEGTVPKAGDKFRVGSKPDSDKPSGIGFSSSSSALNMSTSTVSSMFSTASTVRSKSQFVIPKLKKKG